jgi:predicted dehydrogenase
MKISINRRDFIKLSTIGSLGIGLKNRARRKSSSEKKTKVGIIGLDTSHSIHFTKILNDPHAPPALAGYPVVAAYPRGSLDIKSSVSRIPKYTRQIKKMGVEIVGSVEELQDKVDVVLLETNDGGRHLEQAMKVFKAGKPVFIDKPLAASLADVLAIFDAAAKYNVPMFSASSLRYMKGAQAIRHGKLGNPDYSQRNLVVGKAKVKY